MATQEERLTVLEQTFAIFREETAARTQEIEENTTIMLGVMRAQGQDIKRSFQRLNIIEQRLETMEQYMRTVEQHLGTVEQHLGTVEGQLGTVEGQLGTVEQGLGDVKTAINEHTALLTQILERLPG